ncbi:hypothetical protein BCR44DRAFT_1530319 [Catenaria anguillulae PL171]|uniref:Uncharacterized protein n=1 Tax=Catenaria anguillulae PL171 TaxID=765915 RepID=A0A1Y2HJR8_9FUNG|nr:hypothetical protein BCR44DRAFT_1530319 [Catenaria anguillulae PL171]
MSQSSPSTSTASTPSSASSSLSTTTIMSASTSSSHKPTSTRTPTSSTTTLSSRRTKLVPTTLLSTSTLLTTARVAITIGQGTITSSDIVIATPVIVPVPTVIPIDDSPSLPSDDAHPEVSSGTDQNDVPPAGGDSRGLADHARGNSQGMSPGTKVATALGVGAIALLAVIVATVMLRRSGARERKRTRRASGSLSIGSSAGQPQMPPRPASPFIQAQGQASGYRPAAYATGRLGMLVEEEKAAWTPYASASTQPPAIQLQHLSFANALPPPVHQNNTWISVGSPVSLAERILPPSPMLLASPAGGPTANNHVSRPIVGLSDTSRASFATTVEWELPSATVGRTGEVVEGRAVKAEKRVRWLDGVQSGS